MERLRNPPALQLPPVEPAEQHAEGVEDPAADRDEEQRTDEPREPREDLASRRRRELAAGRLRGGEREDPGEQLVVAGEERDEQEDLHDGDGHDEPDIHGVPGFVPSGARRSGGCQPLGLISGALLRRRHAHSLGIRRTDMIARWFPLSIPSPPPEWQIPISLPIGQWLPFLGTGTVLNIHAYALCILAGIIVADLAHGGAAAPPRRRAVGDHRHPHLGRPARDHRRAGVARAHPPDRLLLPGRRPVGGHPHLGRRRRDLRLTRVRRARRLDRLPDQRGPVPDVPRRPRPWAPPRAGARAHRQLGSTTSCSASRRRCRGAWRSSRRTPRTRSDSPLASSSTRRSSTRSSGTSSVRRSCCSRSRGSTSSGGRSSRSTSSGTASDAPGSRRSASTPSEIFLGLRINDWGAIAAIGPRNRHPHRPEPAPPGTRAQPLPAGSRVAREGHCDRLRGHVLGCRLRAHHDEVALPQDPPQAGQESALGASTAVFHGSAPPHLPFTFREDGIHGSYRVALPAVLRRARDERVSTTRVSRRTRAGSPWSRRCGGPRATTSSTRRSTRCATSSTGAPSAPTRAPATGPASSRRSRTPSCAPSPASSSRKPAGTRSDSHSSRPSTGTGRRSRPGSRGSPSRSSSRSSAGARSRRSRGPSASSLGTPCRTSSSSSSRRPAPTGRAEPSAGLELERQAYRLRKRAERELEVYFPSLSCRTLVYKGMVTTLQLEPFYPDLSDERFVSKLALVHSRYSTNTFPSWPLAQPFRMLAHNGEINTVQGNRNWMRARQVAARARRPERPVPDQRAGRIRLGEPRRGRGAPQPRRTLAPARDDDVRPGGVREPHRRRPGAPRVLRVPLDAHGAVDGPAALVFTDGTLVGGTLDRNGLRPSRYLVTDEGLVVLASEIGVHQIDPSKVVRKGRLRPGRMFLVDTAAGRIIEDDEIKSELANAEPYAEWLAAERIALADPAGARAHRAHPDVGRPASAHLRVHGGGGADPHHADGEDGCGAARRDGLRHARRRALRPTSAALRLLHAAVRPGDEPAARLDPRGGRHVDALGARPGAEPPVRGPGARASGLARVPGARQRRAREDPAHRRPERHPSRDHPRPLPGRPGRERDGAAPASDVRGGGRGDPRRRGVPDPVRPRLDEGPRADPVAAHARGGPPPPHPRADAHADRAHRRGGRCPRGAPRGAAHRLRRLRRQPVPRHGDRGGPRPPRHDRAHLAREGRQEPPQGARQGRPQDHVEDGHLDGELLRGRAVLRSDRALAGVRRRVLHRHAEHPRRRRHRRDRRRERDAARPRLPARRRGARPRAARDRRRVPVASRGAAAPLQPRHGLPAPARDARAALRRLPRLHAPRRRAGGAAHDAPRAVQAADGGAAADPDRRGRADLGDHQALQHGCDELRLDLAGGARDARDRDEPHRRPVEHRGGRRGRRPPARPGASQRDQAGSLRPVRRDLDVPDARDGHPDQDGAGREARRGRAAPRDEGLPVGSRAPATAPPASGSSPRPRTTTSTRSRTSSSSSST